MTGTDTNLDLVTGAFSNTGAGVAQRLIDSGRAVRTLTFHPNRAHPLRASVQALPYQFDDPAALGRSLEGVSTLYNTYWVRYEHDGVTFARAVANSRILFDAARRAGVGRIVHVSVSNPSVDSRLGYFRGKALVEHALGEAGVPYSIVRPTWIFGGCSEVLANNIAWILRRFPIFALPGSGRYPVQPVHIDDVARICDEAAHATGDL
ncbi:MAG TPA: NAD(P)H-binding protein, partial [Solirubrobacteraceae bacterium]